MSGVSGVVVGVWMVGVGVGVSVGVVWWMMTTRAQSNWRWSGW